MSCSEESQETGFVYEKREIGDRRDQETHFYLQERDSGDLVKELDLALWVCCCEYGAKVCD